MDKVSDGWLGGHVRRGLRLRMALAAVLAKHVVPNALSPIIVQWTFIFAYAVLGEASLSFLGVGVPPEVPTIRLSAW